MVKFKSEDIMMIIMIMIMFFIFSVIKIYKDHSFTFYLPTNFLWIVTGYTGECLDIL